MIPAEKELIIERGAGITDPAYSKPGITDPGYSKPGVADAGYSELAR